jgi:hypothetical protein
MYKGAISSVIKERGDSIFNEWQIRTTDST